MKLPHGREFLRLIRTKCKVFSMVTWQHETAASFGGDTPREPGWDLVEFPGLLTKLAERGSTAKYRRPRCIGPVTVEHTEPLLTDLQNMRSAVKAAPPAEAFMNAASPGVIALFQPNDYYPTQDDYLIALAEACAPITRRSWSLESCCRSTLPIWRWGVTRCIAIGRWRSSSSWRRAISRC